MRKFQFSSALVVLSLLMVAGSTQGAPAEKAAAAPSFKSFKEAYSAGNQALKDRKFQEAISDYAAAESMSTTPKGKSQAANAQGWALLRAKKWKEAKEALGRAVEEDKENKVALKNLGVASFRLYEYGFADIEELKEAVTNLEASGENQELLERAKGILSREEAYAQATPVAETTGSGMNFKSLLALGDKLQAEGKFDQALKIFKQAEASGVSAAAKATAANRQGKVLLDARRPTESVAYFEQAVKYQPEEKVYLNNLGFGYWVVYDSGKGGEADLKKAVDAFYKANSIDASYHAENMKMALDELKEVDAEAAKAYSVKDDKEESASEAKADKE
jgi:tetratricopeptide (TPR) repeat protein